MRKTFLTFCAAAFTLLAVSSCGKIEDSLNKLDQGLKDLSARVDKLEKDLNDKIAALSSTVAGLDAAYKAADAEMKAALEAKITAADSKFSEQLSALKSELEEKIGKKASTEELAAEIKKLGDALGEKYTELQGVDAQILAALTKVGVESVVKSENGVVITFGDGSSIELPSNPEEGLVTVVEDESGVKYWAVIVDGEPVVLEDAVFHPSTDLEFMVDPETGELLYSLDGGETWNYTGAYVADSEYTLVTSSYEQGENYVTLFIGGTEYTLPMLSKAQANLLAGKTYFTYGQTKAVSISVKDVKSGFVAKTPKGWAAELDLDALTLTVTAPAEGAGAAEGEIEVWFLSNDGIVKSSVLSVTVGEAPITITVDAKTNDVVLVFNKIEIEGDLETPEVIFGATPTAEFTDEFVDELLSMPTYLLNYYYKNNLDPENPETAPKATSYEGNMSELVSDIDYNTEYVVWAFIPQWSDEYSLENTASDFFKAYHKMANVVVTPVTTTLTDATFTVSFNDPNVTSFCGAILDAASWPQTKSMLESDPSMVAGILEGRIDGSACMYTYDATEGFEGTIKNFGWSKEIMDMYEEWGEAPADNNYNYIQPGSSKMVLIIPFKGEGAEYSINDVNAYEFSTIKPVYDPASTLTATLTESTVGFQDWSMTTEISSPYLFYCVFGPDYELPTSDDEVMKSILGGYMYEFVEVPEDGVFVFAPDEYSTPAMGTTYTAVLVLLGEDGKCKVVREGFSVTTKSPYAPDLTNYWVKSTVEVFDAENNIGVATFTFKGEADYFVYRTGSGNQSSDSYALKIMNAYKNNADKENWGLTGGWTVIDLSEENEAIVDGTEAGTKMFEVKNIAMTSYYTYYANGVLVSVDGENVSLSKISNGSLRYIK